MNSLKKITRISYLNLKKLFHDSRLMLCIIALALFIIGKKTTDLRAFCSALTVKATPFPLFIIITESWYNQKLILYLFLMLICDVPFIDKSSTNILLRAGKGHWYCGTLLYIMGAALLFWLIVFVICTVSILGCCEWSTQWGRVFTSIMKTGEIQELQSSPYYLYGDNAFGVFLRCFSLKYLLTTFLALMTWAVNAATKKNYGIVLPIIIILFHGHYLAWFVDIKWLYFSPVSVSNLSMLNIDGTSPLYPDMRYAYALLIGLNLILIALTYLMSRRADIDSNGILK